MLDNLTVLRSFSCQLLHPLMVPLGQDLLERYRRGKTPVRLRRGAWLRKVWRSPGLSSCALQAERFNSDDLHSASSIRTDFKSIESGPDIGRMATMCGEVPRLGWYWRDHAAELRGLGWALIRSLRRSALDWPETKCPSQSSFLNSTAGNGLLNRKP